VFIEAPAPTPEQLQLLLGKIIARHMRLLTRLGHLIEEEGMVYLARTDTDPDNLLAPLQAASTIWRIARGPRAGRKVLTLVGGNAKRAQAKANTRAMRQCPRLQPARGRAP
jgi:hypothetical protein